MISVCIATYNGAEFIEAQIQSILDQIGKDDEIVVSDDGSTDSTLEIISNFKDKRILIHTHKSSGRPTENFENALIHSKGEIIFLADQDDVWLPDKLTTMVTYLEQNVLVLSDSVLVDENLLTIEPSFFRYHKSRKGVIINALKNSYFGSCMAFKRELLKYSLPFPKTKEIGHDVWLGIIAEIIGKVVFLNKPLLLYRRHSSTVTSHGRGRSGRSLAIKLWSRCVVLKHVGFFYIKYLINGKRISVHHHTNV